MGIDEMDQQVPEDEQVGIGHHGIEGVLHQRPQPAPEQPLHLGHDEKRNKDGSEHHGDRGGDVAEGDHGKHGGLRRQDAEHRDRVVDDRKNIDGEREPRRFHPPVEPTQATPDLLHHRVIQLIGEVEALVDDLHRHAHADIGGKGEGGDEFGQAKR